MHPKNIATSACIWGYKRALFQSQALLVQLNVACMADTIVKNKDDCFAKLCILRLGHNQGSKLLRGEKRRGTHQSVLDLAGRVQAIDEWLWAKGGSPVLDSTGTLNTPGKRCWERACKGCDCEHWQISILNCYFQLLWNISQPCHYQSWMCTYWWPANRINYIIKDYVHY